MNASELQPVVQFLQGLVPFDALPEDVVVRCAKAVTVGYYSKASGYVNFDANSPKLYMVRSGAFEVRDPDGVLVDRVGEGEFLAFLLCYQGKKSLIKSLFLKMV